MHSKFKYKKIQKFFIDKNIKIYYINKLNLG